MDVTTRWVESKEEESSAVQETRQVLWRFFIAPRSPHPGQKQGSRIPGSSQAWRLQTINFRPTVIGSQVPASPAHLLAALVSGTVTPGTLFP